MRADQASSRWRPPPSPTPSTSLTSAHPELRKHLFTGEGKLRAFVNLYLNDEDVRYLPAKEATAVTATDTLSIIPSIAGGASRTGRPGDGAFGALASHATDEL